MRITNIKVTQLKEFRCDWPGCDLPATHLVQHTLCNRGGNSSNFTESYCFVHMQERAEGLKARKRKLERE